MKRKSLIALGVASTFGAAAAVYAATPNPTSVNEVTPWSSHMNRETTMLTPNHVGSQEVVGSTSTSAGGTLSGASNFDHSFSMSSSMTSETGLTIDESMALAHEGVYSGSIR